MRIVVVYGSHKAQGWRDALAAHLPDARIDIWEPGFAEPADYAVGWTPPPRFFIDQPKLRAFFSTGAGVEHVLNNPNLPASLPVVRIEDAGMGEQMVDYCRFEVLRWMQRREEYAAQQAARVWKPLDESYRSDWPVGIFGFGVLGRQVANAFAADGYPVSAFARSTAASEANVRLYCEAKGADQFEAFMRASRVLMIFAPLTPATQDKFDGRTLRLLPQGAYVINVARGGLIVDEGLLELLDSGYLNGASLDVFRQEPLPVAHRYWTHSKVRMTPHTAAITPMMPAAKQIAEKLKLHAADRPVTGLVDRSRGY